MKINHFGIPLDDISPSHALATAQQYLRGGRCHIIVTPNPEMVMRAKYDAAFARALDDADLSLIDGVGLALAVRLLGGTWPYRIPGVDFLMALLESIGGRARVALLGGEHGVASGAAAVLERRYGTRVVGIHEPRRGLYDADNTLAPRDHREHEQLLQALREERPDILIVALGQPLQEKWMATYAKLIPGVKIVIGVGGALDYISGTIGRAPRFLRAIGFEWMWRLFREPKRARRIATATVRFPIEALRWYVSERFLYRQNVVACILNENNEVLLVSRSQDPTHWQFPQGGVDAGETLREAIIRELREELGSDAFTILGRSRRNVYRYQWSRSRTVPMSGIGPQSKRYGYRGQAQTVFYVRYTGQGKDLVLDPHELHSFRWVAPDDLLRVIHPVRRNLASIVLRYLYAHNLHSH